MEYLRLDTTCHSERPSGAKNPSGIEPFGSIPLETLHSPALRSGASVVQGDMTFFVFKVRYSPKGCCAFELRAYLIIPL